MDDNLANAEQIRQYVDSRLNRNRFRGQVALWAVHLVIFLVIFFRLQPLQPDSLMPLVGWFMGLLIHAWAVWLDSGAGERYVRRLIAAQVGRELYDAAETSTAASEPHKEKAKHAALTLSDDGELIELDEANPDAESHPSGQNQPSTGPARIRRSGRH